MEHGPAEWETAGSHTPHQAGTLPTAQQFKAMLNAVGSHAAQQEIVKAYEKASQGDRQAMINQWNASHPGQSLKQRTDGSWYGDQGYRSGERGKGERRGR